MLPALMVEKDSWEAGMLKREGMVVVVRDTVVNGGKGVLLFKEQTVEAVCRKVAKVAM